MDIVDVSSAQYMRAALPSRKLVDDLAILTMKPQDIINSAFRASCKNSDLPSCLLLVKSPIYHVFTHFFASIAHGVRAAGVRAVGK